MGRAIVRQPSAFLMDEPLSNLDAKLRVQMRAEIARLQTDLGTTTIYVTHDQVEAMTMGDRVAVMRKGELLQVRPPQELYDRPDNLFVGGFIGSPAMNMIEASLERQDGTLAVSLGSQRIALGDETLSVRGLRSGLRGQERRPRDPPRGPGGRRARARHPGRPQRLQGQVELREALGAEIMVHFRTDATPAITDETRELQKDVGADEIRRGESRARPSWAASAPLARPRGRAGRGRGRHARASLFRPGDGSRDLRRRPTKGAGS